MNMIERDQMLADIKALREALMSVTGNAEQFVKDLGPCDHDVGICLCAEASNAERARSALQRTAHWWV